jgi:hypothetical protein
MHPARLPTRDGTADGLAIERDRDAAAVGELAHSGRWDDDLLGEMFQLGHIDGLAQNTAPGGVMRHARPLGAKEQLQLVLAEFGPVGELFHPTVAGQFGQHDDGDDQGERVLTAARITAVGQGVGLGIEHVHVDQIGFVRLNEREGQGAILHWTLFWLMA